MNPLPPHVSEVLDEMQIKVLVQLVSGRSPEEISTRLQISKAQMLEVMESLYAHFAVHTKSLLLKRVYQEAREYVSRTADEIRRQSLIRISRQIATNDRMQSVGIHHSQSLLAVGN